MTSNWETSLNDLWQHLTSDRQTWLLGAGASFNAGIPLMLPLTSRVQVILQEKAPEDASLFESILALLEDNSHVEHVLSYLADAISIADRTRGQQVAIGDTDYTSEQLRKFHANLLDHIGYTVRYGYKPASNGQAEELGTPSKPIISVDDHRAFKRALFHARARPGRRQNPISFYTTNYDTLIEDSLAIEHISYSDGLVGGATAYWAPDVAFSANSPVGCDARVIKLHGSVDWYLGTGGGLFRYRDGSGYPEKLGNLMIYPQSTKYVATQRDPFASLFSLFRNTVENSSGNVLAICGYSFGDEHINGEIEQAMGREESKTVIVAFLREEEIEPRNHRLTETIDRWLSPTNGWRERIFVATDQGLYHGSAENLAPASIDRPLDWWTFQGLTKVLAEGLPLIEDREG